MEIAGDLPGAQSLRWTCFERDLTAQALRAHLKALPDFDDLDAEDAALDIALRHHLIHRALAFLIAWPALDRAAQLVERRFRELDGDLFTPLSTAAEALSPRYPLAATLILRSMIGATLTMSRHTRSRLAGAHMAEAARIAPFVTDFAGHADHATYVTTLQVQHTRKKGFWAVVADQPGLE
jgi:hypothetical protein